MSVCSQTGVWEQENENASHHLPQKILALFDLATILGQQIDFQEILRIVAAKAAVLFNAEIVSVFMINPQTQDTIKTIIREGIKPATGIEKIVLPNVIGWVAKNKQPFITHNFKTDPRFKKLFFEEISIASAMCAPLMSEGRTTGYLLVLNQSETTNFDESALILLEKFAAITAPFLSNVQKIQDYFNVHLPASALVAKYAPLGLLGKSEKFIELLRAIEAVARCDVRVLLEGDSGTGKELVARAIHQLSARKTGAFIAIDCGAIPENLIESELFGHLKGAFTGAATERQGLNEAANRGTLFMDEISNLPQNMQAKLLRVLQEGEIRAVGSNRSQKIDVRIIAASSTPLRDLMETQLFREDLFYRLYVYPICVPTLNERPEDILLLADHFRRKFARQQAKKIKSFHSSILNFMKLRNWSGNVRELENFVERLVTLTPESRTVIGSDLLPVEYHQEFKTLTDLRKHRRPLDESLNEFEAKVIREALLENDWNQSKTARALRISERTIRYKIEKLGIKKG